MKKVLFILLTIICCVATVNAEKCEIVSGTGKDIGDQVKCGTEYFRILSNDGEEIKMLAEYNLRVGYIVDRSKEEFDNSSDAWDYCDSLRGVDDCEARYDYDRDIYYCRTYTEIDYDEIVQSEDAVAPYTDADGNWTFPQIGVTYLEPDDIYEEIELEEDLDDIQFGDLITNESSIYPYLNGYRRVLKNKGFNIKSIDLLKANGLEEAISKMIDDEYHFYEERWIEDYDEYMGSSMKVKIRDVVPKTQRWIYQTTYWLGSGYTNYEYDYTETYFDMVVVSSGAVCTYERECNYSRAGAGIRPVVTIDAKDVNYPIEITTDGNGEVKAATFGGNGDKIEYTITPKKGYEIGKITITDVDGNTIETKENKFTMPSSAVKINVTFVVKSPETADIAIGLVIVISIASLLYMITMKKRLNN